MATDGDQDADAASSSELGRRRAVTDLGEAVLALPCSSPFRWLALKTTRLIILDQRSGEQEGRELGGRESSLIERSADQTDDKRSIDRLIE